MKKIIVLLGVFIFLFNLVGCKEAITHQDYFNSIEIDYESGGQNHVSGNFKFFYNENKDVEVTFVSLNEEIIKMDGNKALVTQIDQDIIVDIKISITINNIKKDFTISFNIIKLENSIPSEIEPSGETKPTSPTEPNPTETNSLDQTPPNIIGAMDFVYIISGTIPEYLEGVSAFDDIDGEVEVVVDKSEVDLNLEGVYTIYYMAVDYSGNETIIEKQVMVVAYGSTIESTIETFNNVNSTGSSYVDGSFIGEDGIKWTYINARSDLTLDGKALTFRHESNAKLQTTLSSGLNYFSINAVQVYSGDDIRNIALYINGIEVEVFGVITGDSQTFVVDDLVYTGETIIEIRNIDANRVTIDNIVLGFNNQSEQGLLNNVYNKINIPLTFITNDQITLFSSVDEVSVNWEYVDNNDVNNQYVNLTDGTVVMPDGETSVEVLIKAVLKYKNYQIEKMFTIAVGRGEVVSILESKNTTNGSHVRTKGVVTSSVLKNGIYHAFVEDFSAGVYVQSNIELVIGDEIVFSALKQTISGVVLLTEISDLDIVGTKVVEPAVIKLNQLNNYLGRFVELTGYLTQDTLKDQNEYQLATTDGIITVVLPNYIDQSVLKALLAGNKAGYKVSLHGYVYNSNEIYLLDANSLYVDDVIDNEIISEIIIRLNSFPTNNQEIIKDINLPTSDYAFNSTISWLSYNPDIISSSGRVTPPSSNTSVTLYYEIKIGSLVIKQDYIDVIVLKAQTLISYYSAAEGKTGNDLFTTLRSIITTGRKNTSYDLAKTILQDTDRDPNNSNNILLVYNRESIKKEWLSSLPWNREHVWPQSFLGSAPQGEIHNLKPADVDINSSRGNKKFARGSGTYAIVSGGFYPGDEDIGDVARIMFYMITAYKDLNINTMGSLEMFIEWHYLDPVDDFERNRNEVIYSYTNNRNPYIDYPEFVSLIWEDQTTYQEDNYQALEAYIYQINNFYIERKKYYLEG